MTDTDDAIPDPVADAFARHDAFERNSKHFELQTTAFDVTATATSTDDENAGSFRVSLTVPTLSATTAEHDDVADVVEDGWLETFERRLEDAFDVAKTSDGEPPVVEREDDVVAVEFGYEPRSAPQGVDDAKVLAEYVEGTFLQGLIPGYDYVGVAADLRSAATQNATDGEDRSGTPL